MKNETLRKALKQFTIDFKSLNTIIRRNYTQNCLGFKDMVKERYKTILMINSDL